MKDVGPSTATFFQGGEMGLGVEDCRVAESASFRRLGGGPLSWTSL